MKDNTDKNIKGEAVCSGNFSKTGLVLEGGAMRGMFTAGVLDVLMENEIYTDGVVGVSAGAVLAVITSLGKSGGRFVTTSVLPATGGIVQFVRF